MIPVLAIASMANIAIAIVVAVVVIGIAMIVVRQSGIVVPPWFWQIVWLVVLAVVAIIAIRFVMTL
jgi:hypothetical protein